MMGNQGEARERMVRDMEEIRFCYRCGSPMSLQLLEGRLRPVCTACGGVFFLDPKVVAAVVADIGGKIVMMRRALEPGRGKWAVPGGYVDRGEVLEKAAMREVEEETGLTVEVTALIGIYSRPEDANILVVYAGKVVGGQLTAGAEAQEVCLFDVESLPPLAFERDAGIIRQWQAMKVRSSVTLSYGEGSKT